MKLNSWHANISHESAWLTSLTGHARRGRLFNPGFFSLWFYFSLYFIFFTEQINIFISFPELSDSLSKTERKNSCATLLRTFWNKNIVIGKNTKHTTNKKLCATITLRTAETTLLVLWELLTTLVDAYRIGVDCSQVTKYRIQDKLERPLVPKASASDEQLFLVTQPKWRRPEVWNLSALIHTNKWCAETLSIQVNFSGQLEPRRLSIKNKVTTITLSILLLINLRITSKNAIRK